jgi:hypothetical protein
VTVLGIHHVKFPVRDLARSRGWYEQVFGLEVVRDFREDGVVHGVAYRMPATDVMVALREAPGVAGSVGGFDPVAFLVEDRAALSAWCEHLDAMGIAHAPVVAGTAGWMLEFEGRRSTATPAVRRPFGRPQSVVGLIGSNCSMRAAPYWRQICS